MDFETNLDVPSLKGLFSFSVYWTEQTPFRKSKYYKGLEKYLSFVGKLAFVDWGVIIYTDNHSIDTIKEAFPKDAYRVIYAVVHADPFQIEYGGKTMMDQSILTCMRYHALEEFPHCIISVRDADTVFPIEMQILDDILFLEELYEWERVFHEKAQELPEKSMILGTSVTYRNPWHVNSRPNNRQLMYAPVGLFAGFATFLLNRPTDIWTLLWDYLLSRYSYKVNGYIWNYQTRVNDQPIAFGKDERFFFFGVITEKPEYLSQIFFFELNYRATLAIPKRIQLPLKMYESKYVKADELKRAYSFARSFHRGNLLKYSLDMDMFYTKALQPQAILQSFVSDEVFQTALPPYIELHNKWLHRTLTAENMYAFEEYSLAGGTRRRRHRQRRTRAMSRRNV